MISPAGCLEVLRTHADRMHPDFTRRAEVIVRSFMLVSQALHGARVAADGGYSLTAAQSRVACRAFEASPEYGEAALLALGIPVSHPHRSYGPGDLVKIAHSDSWPESLQELLNEIESPWFQVNEHSVSAISSREHQLVGQLGGDPRHVLFSEPGEHSAAGTSVGRHEQQGGHFRQALGAVGDPLVDIVAEFPEEGAPVVGVSVKQSHIHGESSQSVGTQQDRPPRALVLARIERARRHAAAARRRNRGPR